MVTPDKRITVSRQLLLAIAAEATEGTSLSPEGLVDSWHASSYAGLTDEERRGKGDNLELMVLPLYVTYVMEMVERVVTLR